jgi:hypothetical protein
MHGATIKIEDTSFSLVTRKGEAEFMPVHAMQTYTEVELHPFFISEMGGDDSLVFMTQSL